MDEDAKGQKLWACVRSNLSTVNLVWLRSEKENGQPVEKRGTENIWAYLAKRYRVYLTKLSFTLLYNEPLLDPSVAMDRMISSLHLF